MPRIARRVVCGRTETIATWLPTIALTRVDLPTLGRPARPTKPERFTGCSAITRSCRASISPLVRLVVHAAEVKGAVHGCLGHVGAVLGADRHVSQLARARGRAGAVDRKGEHVGRRVHTAVVAIQLADPLLVDQLDGDVAALDSGCAQCGFHRGAQPLRGDYLHVEGS